MVRSHKKGGVLALLSGILWASYSVTLYSWLSPYNGDSGTLDSARGIMFIILAAIGIAWIDALITFVFELGYQKDVSPNERTPFTGDGASDAGDRVFNAS